VSAAPVSTAPSGGRLEPSRASERPAIAAEGVRAEPRLPHLGALAGRVARHVFRDHVFRAHGDHRSCLVSLAVSAPQYSDGVSYPAYLAGGWLRCRSARASLAACLQHLVAMASKSAAGGSRARAAQARWACCVSTDREKGLWSAAKGRRLRFMAPAKTQGYRTEAETRCLSM
jgi:hypothetical protein